MNQPLFNIHKENLIKWKGSLRYGYRRNGETREEFEQRLSRVLNQMFNQMEEHRAYMSQRLKSKF